jgi:hypothetical protein
MIFNAILLGIIWGASIKLDDCTFAVLLTLGYILDCFDYTHLKKNSKRKSHNQL